MDNQDIEGIFYHTEDVEVGFVHPRDSFENSESHYYLLTLQPCDHTLYNGCLIDWFDDKYAAKKPLQCAVCYSEFERAFIPLTGAVVDIEDRMFQFEAAFLNAVSDREEPLKTPCLMQERLVQFNAGMFATAASYVANLITARRELQPPIALFGSQAFQKASEYFPHAVREVYMGVAESQGCTEPEVPAFALATNLRHAINYELLVNQVFSFLKNHGLNRRDLVRQRLADGKVLGELLDNDPDWKSIDKFVRMTIGCLIICNHIQSQCSVESD